MMSTFSAKGMLIEQQQFQQILMRGKGDGKFADTVNKEISLLPPLDNLRTINNENYIFSKQSFTSEGSFFFNINSPSDPALTFRVNARVVNNIIKIFLII